MTKQTSHAKDRTLAGGALAAFLVFLWQVKGVIGDLNSWEGWNQPAMAAQILNCVILAGGAFAAAFGVDVPDLLRGFGVNLGPSEPKAPRKAKKPPVA